MTSKQKEIGQIEISKEDLQKFTQPKVAERFINNFNKEYLAGYGKYSPNGNYERSLNLVINEEKNQNKKREEIAPRTEEELKVFFSRLKKSFVEEKPNYKLALNSVEKIGEDTTKSIEERYAQIRNEQNKIEELKRIPTLTTKEEKPKKYFEPETTQNMINTEDKKTKTSEIYLFPYNKKFELGDKTIVKIIIEIDENKRDNTANKFRDAVLIKDMENVIGEVLEKPHKIAVYYEDKKGNQIRYEIKSEEITKMFDEQLKKLDGKELLAMSRGVRTE